MSDKDPGDESVDESVDDAPVEEAPDEEAPDEEVPDEEAPDEEAPDEEAPDEEEIVLGDGLTTSDDHDDPMDGVPDDTPAYIVETIKKSGPLAYMAKNRVAANLIMLLLIIGGLMVTGQIKQEVFPEFSQGVIDISVTYPGSTPSQVEDSIIRTIEQEVSGIDGVKEVTATAAENVGRVSVKLLLGADEKTVLQDVQAAVDRISSFPADAERPIVSIRSNRQQAVSIIVYGDQKEEVLKEYADEIKDELVQLSDITLVQIGGLRPPEISIEVSQNSLRKYGLTLPQIAQTVKASAVDVPGGGIKGPGGEVRVRTNERKETGEEFERITVLSQPNGTTVPLDRVGTVVDGFADNDVAAFFNGKRAARVDVYRVGDQTPVGVSLAVKAYLKQKQGEMPDGVELALWNDSSEIYRDRIDLLLRNGYLGLLLVLGVLGLFLNLRLAFWVTMGIPISFLGAMLFMPATGVSLNMISLFAFILTLGIVVDDAIVVGEAVYKFREEGLPPLAAAIAGVREVAAPVIFSVVTTMVAFSPLLLVPGNIGNVMSVIPAIVIVVLFLSLVESLLVLPAHLSHGSKPSRFLPLVMIGRLQKRFADFVQKMIRTIYMPTLRISIGMRYLTIAVAVAMLAGTIGYMRAGHVPFTFIPKVEGDQITANVRMPFGTPVEETEVIQARMVRAAQDTFDELGSEEKHSRGIYSSVGSRVQGGGPGGFTQETGAHLTQVQLYLVAADQRDWTSADFAKIWRERMGEVAGAENVSFIWNLGPSAGAPVDIELSHPNADTLNQAAEELAAVLDGYGGVTDIDSGVSLGKEQLEITLKPEGRALGINELELARQIQAGYFGAEAVRQTRGRDEVRVYVRLPREERNSEYSIENLLIRTPQGGEIPLARAANLERGRAFTSIQRKNLRRVIHVTADVEEGVTTGNKVVEKLTDGTLDDLTNKYKGLTWSMGGEQQEQAEAFGALGSMYIIALLVMFGLMAVAFKSYIQPIIIMLAIPFGVVGAIGGHILMGFELSIISILGIVALSGVVVNDSLVLITAVNTLRRQGLSAEEAIVQGAVRRFRPILLTTLTTFFGLVPMISETSVQARFLIPMAISLAFGVLFTTFVILVLVPSVYMAIEDIKRTVSRVAAFLWPSDDPEPVPGDEAVEAG